MANLFSFFYKLESYFEFFFSEIDKINMEFFIIEVTFC